MVSSLARHRTPPPTPAGLAGIGGVRGCQLGAAGLHLQASGCDVTVTKPASSLADVTESDVSELHARAIGSGRVQPNDVNTGFTGEVK